MSKTFDRIATFAVSILVLATTVSTIV